VNNYKIAVKCPRCEREYILPCNKEDLIAFQNGEKLAQEAFPYMPAQYREMLISGLCPECWDEIFSDEE